MTLSRDREAATLTDRVALGFLSGLCALLLGGLLWCGAWVASAQLHLDLHLPFAWVVFFASVMALLGFVLLENFVGAWIGSFARWVLNALRVIWP